MNKLSNINESGIISQLNRHLAGDIERKGTVVNMYGVENHHTFTDKNGKTHLDGYILTNKDVVTLKKLILELTNIRGNDCDLNDIDVSNLEDLSCTFANGIHGDWKSLNLTFFNGDISGWDTSNTLFFSNMFCGSKFNGDISKWDVRKATNMSFMFLNSDFSGDVSSWEPDSHCNVLQMFYNCPRGENCPKWYYRIMLERMH